MKRAYLTPQVEVRGKMLDPALPLGLPQASGYGVEQRRALVYVVELRTGYRYQVDTVDGQCIAFSRIMGLVIAFLVGIVTIVLDCTTAVGPQKVTHNTVQPGRLGGPLREYHRLVQTGGGQAEATATYRRKGDNGQLRLHG